MIKMFTVMDFITALDSVTYYNGLAHAVRGWKRLQKYEAPSESYGAEDAGDIAQLQVIWMMCVSLFGDYGVSPRYGWIENIDGFHDFIDLITKSEQ